MISSFKPLVNGLAYTPAPITNPTTTRVRQDRLRLGNIRQILAEFDQNYDPNLEYNSVRLAEICVKISTMRRDNYSFYVNELNQTFPAHNALF